MTATESIIDTLGQLELFRGCTEETLRLVALAHPESVTIGPTETLCREGDNPDCWWVVLEGEGLVTSGGKAVGTVSAADAVGELALLDDQPRSATVTATTTLGVLELDSSTFMEALNSSPQLTSNILRQQTTRMRSTNLGA